MKPAIRISVRNLVEFIRRSGDLTRTGGARDTEAMQKGSRLHRRLQKQMGSQYRAEVSLKTETEYEDLILKVEGRADGIFLRDELPCIDEIKGTYKSLDTLEEPIEVHRAQALCYAWIYLNELRLDKIAIQLTYVHLESEEVRRFFETVQEDWLCGWYQNLVDEYHKWLSFQLAWREKRNASIQALEFPFEYRKGQREMVAGIYHAISQKQQIFVQAPTGVGKTMSALFPSVRSLGEGKAEMIFYLTARTITRTVAQDAFGILRNNGLKIKNITLTAKEKLCLCENAGCDPEKCPYAKGYMDRINEAVYTLWTGCDDYDRGTILEYAERFMVCPFEMSLELSSWVDAVICDYNYVFDPNVCLKRFFGDTVSGDYIFLIDEAHNLADRGREMYSASIGREELLNIKKYVKPFSPKLSRLLAKASRELKGLAPENEERRILSHAGSILLTLLSAQGEMDKLLEEPPFPEFPDGILDFYFRVRDFLNISELTDDNYVIYSAYSDSGDLYLKLFCVNPAENLQKGLDKGVCSVFFSATLLPLSYYRRMLCTRSDNFGMYVTSPFDAENRLLLSGVDVSSRYSRRGYDEYRKIAEYIARFTWQKKGNYMIFFPSYRLMDEVWKIYQDEFSADWVRCICQHPEMNEKEREEFLEEFSMDKKDTLVGFCVMGGVFSEGIDLMGDRLIGAAVVGTGIPQVGLEREILKDYYDKKGENGFDYAYRLPGMNKVLQAAGRVIRTREDTGVILLLDERFCETQYRSLFPKEWSDLSYCRLDSLEDMLKKFWKKMENRQNLTS